MTIKEQQGMNGRLTILLRDRYGRVVAHYKMNNLITTAGRELIAELFTGAVQGKPELTIAVGEDPTAAVSTDTSLRQQSDQALATTPAVRRVEEDGQQRLVATVTATLPALSGDRQQELREAGIMIKLPNREPVLYNRVTFPVITRTGNLEMTLTWEVIF